MIELHFLSSILAPLSRLLSNWTVIRGCQPVEYSVDASTVECVECVSVDCGVAIALSSCKHLRACQWAYCPFVSLDGPLAFSSHSTVLYCTRGTDTFCTTLLCAPSSKTRLTRRSCHVATSSQLCFTPTLLNHTIAWIVKGHSLEQSMPLVYEEVVKGHSNSPRIESHGDLDSWSLVLIKTEWSSTPHKCNLFSNLAGTLLFCCSTSRVVIWHMGAAISLSFKSSTLYLISELPPSSLPGSQVLVT